jgi:hypothetical protein
MELEHPERFTKSERNATASPSEPQTPERMLFFPSRDRNIRVYPEEIIYADTCKSCTTVHMDGDKLLDNQDLCLLLGITKRSLARYRQKKLIRFYRIDCKTYYKASEVEEFLKTRGKKPG